MSDCRNSDGAMYAALSAPPPAELARVINPSANVERAASAQVRRHDPPALLAHEIQFMQECMAAHGLPDMDGVAAERMLVTIVGLQQQLAAARAKLLELAGDCAECGGSSLLTGVDPSDGAYHDRPCPDCADIRELC